MDSPGGSSKAFNQVGNERVGAENTSPWGTDPVKSVHLHLCEVLDSIIISSAKERKHKYLRM